MLTQVDLIAMVPAAAAIILPYYFFALIGCAVLCGLLTWRDYEQRVAAFGFSFSFLFAAAWAVMLILFGRGTPNGLVVILGLMALTFVLFAVCAVISGWFYFRGRPVAEYSRLAWGVGITLAVAHLLHLFLGGMFTAIGSD